MYLIGERLESRNIGNRLDVAIGQMHTSESQEEVKYLPIVFIIILFVLYFDILRADC